MSGSLDPNQLVTEALAASGQVKLATLLAALVPVEELRAVGKKFGVAPKGYRIERAPIGKIAELLAESQEPKVLEAATGALAAIVNVSGGPPSDEVPAPTEGVVTSLRAQVELKQVETEQAKADVERHRAQIQQLRERDVAFQRRLDAEFERQARLAAEINQLRLQMARDEGGTAAANVDSTLVHDLQRDLDLLTQTEETNRRRLSEQSTRIRELESEVEDLLARVPKHRRRKEPPPPPPPLPEQFRLPHWNPSFYKSLGDKDRRSIEAAMRAVLLFCTEGPAYPGLEVKQIEGQDLWSLRASLKLRVYFRLRDDGDAEFVALADREDQHTTLRRLKER